MALNICSRKGYNSYPQVQRVEAWAQKAEHWATEDFSQLWNLMETCWTLKLLESSDPFLLCMSLLLKWEWLSLLFYACPTIEFGACFPVHRSAPEWIIHRVSTIPDLDNVDVEIWDFGLFCNRMRFLEMLGWGKYILLVGWMWILGSQDADYSYYSWWQITPKLNGTKQSFIMIPGFIRSRCGPVAAELFSAQWGWDVGWKTQRLGMAVIWRLGHSHVWRLILAVGWGSQLLLIWKSLVCLTV